MPPACSLALPLELYIAKLPKFLPKTVPQRAFRAQLIEQRLGLRGHFFAELTLAKSVAASFEKLVVR